MVEVTWVVYGHCGGGVPGLGMLTVVGLCLELGVGLGVPWVEVCLGCDVVTPVSFYLLWCRVDVYMRIG